MCLSQQDRYKTEGKRLTDRHIRIIRFLRPASELFQSLRSYQREATQHVDSVPSLALDRHDNSAPISAPPLPLTAFLASLSLCSPPIRESRGAVLNGALFNRVTFPPARRGGGGKRIKWLVGPRTPR